MRLFFTNLVTHLKFTQVLSLGAILLMGLLNGCVSTSTYEAAVSQYDAAAKEREALKSNVQLLKNKIESYEQQTKKLGLELDDTTNLLSAKNQALREHEEKLQLTAAELAEKNEALRTKSLELNATSEELQMKEQALVQTQEQLKAAADRVAETHKLYDDLVGELNSELNAKQIKIKQMKDGIVVNLAEAILFPSGSATLNDSGEKVITKVSDKLQTVKYQIIVAGFTDDIPIKGPLSNKFPTNWELAAARASSVVRLLEKNGLDSDKLAAVSYGETHPVESNETPEGRAQNRRIEIRLRPIE